MTLYICSPSSVFAESWDPAFTFNGFYTIDASQTNKDSRIVAGPRSAREFEQNKLSFRNSIIGAQLEYQVTDRLSAFVQGVSYLNEQDSLTADIDWAYISYQFDADISLRVGHFQVPFLQGTELRKIGFSRLWSRPLIPGNGASGYRTFQGIEVFKNIMTSSGDWQIQLSLGETEHERDDINGKTIALFSARYQQNNFWLRSAAGQVSFDIAPAGNTTLTTESHLNLISLEGQWQIKSNQLNFGVSRGEADIVPNDTLMYASLAHQIEYFHPYVFWVQRQQKFAERRSPMQNPPNMPGMGQMPGQGARPPIPPGTIESNADNYGLGVRWNFSPQLALKAQVEHQKTEVLLRNGDPRKDSLNILSLTLGGVF